MSLLATGKRMWSNAGSARGWYRDRSVWTAVGPRYVLALATLSLAWEIAQLPLYTIWREDSIAWMAFSVAHCTLGDVAIGIAALLLALIATRAVAPGQWRWELIASFAALVAISYTAFSEWMNTAVLQSWSYSDLMPTLGLMGTEIGASPLLQWLVIPPLALRFARGYCRKTQAA